MLRIPDPQEGRAIDAEALASRRSKPSISDDDGGLSNSDSEFGTVATMTNVRARANRPFEHEQAQPTVRPTPTERM
jgi:hypothetical protein